MIDYKNILREMIKNNSIKSATSLEHNKEWYQIEIKIGKIEDRENPNIHRSKIRE